MLRTVGLATAGVGIVGIAVGTMFGPQAKSRRDDAGCPNSICKSDEDAAKLRDAQTSGNFATVFFIAGGVLAAAGVTLWLVAPSPPSGTSVAFDGTQLRVAW